MLWKIDEVALASFRERYTAVVVYGQQGVLRAKKLKVSSSSRKCENPRGDPVQD